MQDDIVLDIIGANVPNLDVQQFFIDNWDSQLFNSCECAFFQILFENFV